MAGTPYCRYSNRNITQRSGGRYDYTETWVIPGIINTDSVVGTTNYPINTWQNEALQALGTTIGDINQDGGVVCVSVNPKSLDNQATAYVDVRWQEDPLTLATDVHYFSATKTKPAWQGMATTPGTIPNVNASSKDIRNSAGDRFNPPVTYEAAMERIEITCHRSIQWHDTGQGPGGRLTWIGDWSLYLKRWNVRTFTVTQNDPDKIANKSTRTFSPGSLMLVDKRAPLVKEPYYHRLVTCVFLYDPDLWGQRVPDIGPRCYKHLGQSGGAMAQVSYPGGGLGPVTDAMGRPFGGVAELDGSGNQLLPSGSAMPALVPGTNYFQWWPVDDYGYTYSADFTELQLFTPERTLKI